MHNGLVDIISTELLKKLPHQRQNWKAAGPSVTLLYFKGPRVQTIGMHSRKKKKGGKRHWARFDQISSLFLKVMISSSFYLYRES